MAVNEKNVLLTGKDASGNKNLLYPITKLDCVDGAEDLVHFGAAQTLTSTEKAQARSNIGAQAAGDYAQVSQLPTAASLGLGNVDNTSDKNKPVSTAQATAITDAKTNDVSGNAFQRVYCSMIPYGTKINANTDLNTTALLAVGNYYCTKNADVATLTNCPTSLAFAMQVYSPLSTTIDNETTSTWVYRLRRIITHKGVEYYQFVNSGSTKGTFTYGPWVQTATKNDIPTSLKNPKALTINGQSYDGSAAVSMSLNKKATIDGEMLVL